MKFKKLLSLGIALVLSASSFAPASCASVCNTYLYWFSTWAPQSHRKFYPHFEVTPSTSISSLCIEAQFRLAEKLDSILISILDSQAFLPNGKYNEEILKNDLLKLSDTNRKALREAAEYVFMGTGISDDRRKLLLGYLWSNKSPNPIDASCNEYYNCLYTLMYRLNIVETVLPKLPRPQESIIESATTHEEQDKDDKSFGSIPIFAEIMAYEKPRTEEYIDPEDEGESNVRLIEENTDPEDEGESNVRLIEENTNPEDEGESNVRLIEENTELEDEGERNIALIKEKMPDKRVIRFSPKSFDGSFSQEDFETLLKEENIPFKRRDTSGNVVSSHDIAASSDPRTPIIYFGKDVVFQYNSLSNYEIDCDLIICGSTIINVKGNHITGKCILYQPKIYSNTGVVFESNTFDKGLYITGSCVKGPSNYSRCPITPPVGGDTYYYGHGLVNMQKVKKLEFGGPPTFEKTLDFATSAQPVTATHKEAECVQDIDAEDEDEKNIRLIEEKTGRKVISFCPPKSIRMVTVFSQNLFDMTLQRMHVTFTHNGKSHKGSNRPIIYFGKNAIFPSRESLQSYEIDCDIIICGSKIGATSIRNNHILGKCILYNPNITADSHVFTNNVFDEGLYIIGSHVKKAKAGKGYPITSAPNTHTNYLYGKGLMSDQYLPKGKPAFEKEPTFEETLDFVMLKSPRAVQQVSVHGSVSEKNQPVTTTSVDHSEDTEVQPPPSKRRNVEPGNADEDNEHTEYDS